MSEESEASPEVSIIDRLSAFQVAEEAPNEPVAEAVPEAPVEAASEVEATDTEQPDQPEETVEAGSLVDIEFDGKQFKVAPEIREAVMRHADYTRKTTELAEHRTLFQKEREMAEHHAAFNQSIDSENQELAQLDAQLAQFKALPWDEFDVQQMVKATHARDALRERKTELTQSVEAKRNEYTQLTQKSRNELIQTGVKYLSKVVPGWSKETYDGAIRAATTAGYTEGEAKNMVDPRALHLMWKADQWDKLQAAKPVVQKKASEVPPVVKPGSQATTESKASTQYNKLRAELKRTGDPKIAQELMKFR